MPDYKRMYFELAAKIADVIDILTVAQQRGEEAYMREESPVIHFTEIDQQKDEQKQTHKV